MILAKMEMASKIENGMNTWWGCAELLSVRVGLKKDRMRDRIVELSLSCSENFRRLARIGMKAFDNTSGPISQPALRERVDIDIDHVCYHIPIEQSNTASGPRLDGASRSTEIW